MLSSLYSNELLHLNSGPLSSYCFTPKAFAHESFTRARELALVSKSEVGDASEGMHILSHVYRSKETKGAEGVNGRCFFDLEQVLALSDVFAFKCRGYCGKHFVGDDLGQVNIKYLSLADYTFF